MRCVHFLNNKTVLSSTKSLVFFECPYMRKIVVIKKEENIWEEVALQKYFALRKVSKIFHDIEGAKYKMLTADSDLERTVTVFQGKDFHSIL